MNSESGVWARRVARLLHEPTVVFFVIGAAIFLVHRLLAGDPRTIIAGTAVRSDLTRRFQDQMGRPPSGAEIDTALQSWKRDEALYREALRDGIDREDPMVRARLIERVRERLASEFATREPSPAELELWLAQHRNLYELPLVYEHEYIVFPRSDPAAERKRAKSEAALRAGATPTSLGLRTVAAHVHRERIEEEFGADVASRVCSLPVAEWHSLENQNSLILVRMIRVEGGLPNFDVLRERLVMDWKSTRQNEAVERAAQDIAGRYRFEEHTK